MSLPAGPSKPPTTHGLVDAPFAAVLQEQFGIPATIVLRKLRGESPQRAIAMCRWASRFEEPNGMLLVWGGTLRKHGRVRLAADGPPRRRAGVSPRRPHNRPGASRAPAPARPEKVRPPRPGADPRWPAESTGDSR